MSHANLVIYANGPAYNHGCEAIVRGTTDILALEKESTVLFSPDVEGDQAFGLDKLVQLRPIAETPLPHTSPLGVWHRACSRLSKDHVLQYHRRFGKYDYKYLYGHGKIALSVGGDNYCYDGALMALNVRNYWLNKMGTKTILWGASLSEEFLTRRTVEDLNRYSLIVVREHLSEGLLKDHGVRTEIVVSPDPAFALKGQDTEWPDGKTHSNVVGINISHFVSEYSATKYSGIQNYLNLIKWILNETDMEIAMIPHVVFPNDPGNNDLLRIKELLQMLPPSDRIITLDGQYNACQLKSLIGKCRFFIGARTHATIAAYSSCVPTLVVGYSTKSIGIARELFGSETGYVCSVQKMIDENMLQEAFQNIVLHENALRHHLASTIPVYTQGHKRGVEAVNSWIR